MRQAALLPAHQAAPPWPNPQCDQHGVGVWGKGSKDQGGLCRLCCWCHLNIWATLSIFWKQRKVEITSLNSVLKTEVSKASVSLVFRLVGKKKNVGWYYSLKLQRKLRGQSHFHYEPDKDSCFHTGDKLLIPVDHLFPNSKTHSQGILSKAQSCQMVNTVVHYQSA